MSLMEYFYQFVCDPEQVAQEDYNGRLTEKVLFVVYVFLYFEDYVVFKGLLGSFEALVVEVNLKFLADEKEVYFTIVYFYSLVLLIV